IPSLTNAFSVGSLPDIQTANSKVNAGMVKEMSAVASISKPVSEGIEKSRPAKVKPGMDRLGRVNSKNSLLHNDLKQSGRYLELSTLLFNFDQYKNIDTQDFNVILQLADKL